MSKDQEKTQDEAKNAAEKSAKLHEEAKSLGVTQSKTRVRGAKTKDLDAEAKKHADLAEGRLENRVKKARAKPKTRQQIRKNYLKARLSHSHDFKNREIAQAKWELEQMRLNKWKEGRRMPKSKTVYDEIIDN